MHRVGIGESLFGIAQAHGFSVAVIKEANRLKHDQTHVGQFLALLLKESDRGLFPDPIPQLIVDPQFAYPDVKITLRLANVPASEALQYITSPAQCRYRVEGETIYVKPLRGR